MSIDAVKKLFQVLNMFDSEQKIDVVVVQHFKLKLSLPTNVKGLYLSPVSFHFFQES